MDASEDKNLSPDITLIGNDHSNSRFLFQGPWHLCPRSVDRWLHKSRQEQLDFHSLFGEKKSFGARIDVLPRNEAKKKLQLVAT